MEENNQQTCKKPRRARKLIAAGALALLVIGAVGVTCALSGRGGPGGFAGGRFHGPGFGERGLERVLASVDVTAEQEKRIWAIIDDARSEVRPVFREFRDTRGTVAELLGAATLDRAAFEALRAERIAALDGASRTLTQAALDAAEVLTPEQRAELVERVQERGRHWR